MFKRILSVLTARWFVSLIGAIILALLVWFVGPLIAIGDVRPLDSEIIRLIVVLVILVIWGVWNIISLLRAKKSNDQLVQGISQASAADAQAADLQAAKEEEVGVLKERLDDALVMLKRAKLGKGSNRQYLYQLPWYILIGPPGSGKTTALVNSGLNFPLADKFGKDAVRGVGGTRNCDWWFTDEAVLIDTAGRYTTQDSHQAVDAAAWTGFLKLLKSTRPRQPINGALIAISLNDLATMKEAERQSHARTIKQRIKELHDQLGIRFPIYVLFTKVDLAAGFIEFMDDLGKEERQQVWGFTFPLDDGKSPEGPMAGFDEEFELLQERLYQRLLERVHKEPDIDRRSMIFSFPTQMASLKQVSQEFLDQIFRPTRYEDRPLLRGVYFTSGTQEGTPIDRLMGVLASTFGLDRKRLSAFSGAGRSYFLTRLLREVVFQEAGIVSRNRRVERMRVFIGWASVSLATVVILGMAALWYSSYLGNKQLIADFNTAIGTYKQQVATSGLTLNPVQDARLDLILPPLQTLRTMPAGYEQSRAGLPWSLRFGLYQGGKLGVDADAAYRRALNGLLLPRLIYILENQLHSNIDNAEFVYGRLKVYLMLGVQGPLDRALVEGWMTGLLNEAFPGAVNEGVRNQYMAHLSALLEAPLTPVALDGGLVQQAQATLAKLPMADRAYTLIQQDPDVRSLPPWRVVDHIGPAGGRVLVRKSGANLNEGVPGFYTVEGFQKVFVAKLADITHEITKDSWVLGPNAQAGGGNAGAARLAIDVMALYLNDYVDKWVQLVGDVRIRPESDLRKLAEMLNILSGPNSPLKNLYLDIARETKLTADEQSKQGVDPSQLQQKATDLVTQDLRYKLGGKGVMGRILGDLFLQGGGTQADLAALPDAPEKRVEERFDWLQAYVAGSPAPIDGLLQQLNQVYLQLNGINTALDQGNAALGDVTGGGGPLAALQSLATQAPGPLGEMLAGVASGAGGSIKQRSAGELNDRWKSNGAQLCSTLLLNRYPLYPNSPNDAAIDDFARVFAPGQLMDSFFKANLANVVDTSSIPWKAQGDIPISTGALEQFRLASKISEALFRGGSTPSSSFEITPIALDNAATQVLLEVNGQAVTYKHDPQVPVLMQWPGSGVQQVRLSFQPQSGGGIELRGPWALFRLIDQGQIAKLGSEHFQITFNVDGHSATYDIQARSALNPFSLKELHQFRCPGRLDK
jgi:type VI secretion system protein ImpL